MKAQPVKSFFFLLITVSFIFEFAYLFQSCKPKEKAESFSQETSENNQQSDLVRVNHDPNYLGDQNCKSCMHKNLATGKTLTTIEPWQSPTIAP